VGELRPEGRANIKSLLERTREAGSVDATVARLITTRLELDHVSVIKRGARITTSAEVARSALAASLPAGISLTNAAGSSEAIALAAHVTLFGQTISATALLEARKGRIEIVASSPLVPPITLFADPELAVDALQVAVHGGYYTFSAQGHLT
jgi:hypothetical protein